MWENNEAAQKIRISVLKQRALSQSERCPLCGSIVDVDDDCYGIGIKCPNKECDLGSGYYSLTSWLEVCGLHMQIRRLKQTLSNIWEMLNEEEDK